ncbi:PTS sugar transporter subunit IIA [Vagococcus fluvialis]|uniref:PTS sugar transporter subunit IIA n=1 Tax=Vagococcus fluvialis TaxID=2738 RepID=UPI00143313DD|nr:PTS sugar transporter subunit IIA [Vagococcus fluvialis]MBO0437184.1 PTS sugar transporter subunit IIA [Vagococcus fluvialis]MBO0443002.1 PTS sugar transporter subunit IIA [Vagococcus fluvialis]MBO0479069.1 PTS sugar transporter subunit IIA [Vagococcus fluvialis]MBO0483462.1 PTS sugar transporter subunit IIA [Vagococcus fluvialis]MBO0487357.1 PTS sugar transporter subunit IIA [Vagococcus fluvialis]
MLFDESVINFQINPSSQEELLSSLSDQLLEKGVVKDTFVTGIIDREKNFPTGLPVQPFGVAIPHTDNEHVVKEQIGFASLKEPVKFKIMGSDSDYVDVSLVFILALKYPDKQLDMLQKLITLFQNEGVLNQLYECNEVDLFKEIMRTNNII